MRSLERGLVLLLLATASSLVASSAAAAPPSKEECIAAFDRAQEARRNGHLRRAHEDLVVCSQEVCPSVVRTDCSGVLRQVEAVEPSIVLKAEDAKGADLTDVSVELDGAPFVNKLDGRAVPVDPGKLTLVFRRPPWEPVTVQIVIAESEKSRIVRATLGPPAPSPEPARAVLRDTPPPQARAERSFAGWLVPGAFAVIGAGALTFASVRRVQLDGDADDLKERCGPVCPQAERDRMSSDLVTTNVMFAVGLGSLVLAAASWFVFAPRSSPSRPTKAALTW